MTLAILVYSVAMLATTTILLTWRVHRLADRMLKLEIKEEWRSMETAQAIKKQHYVTFQSPGTFFAETTTKPIDRWDSCEAARLGADVIERYGQRPFGFYFTTAIEAVIETEGIQLDAKKTIETSGAYYLGGAIRGWDELEERHGILRDNMRCNDWPLVILVGGDGEPSSARACRPFEPRDVLVHPETGAMVCRGDDVEMRARRESIRAVWAAAGWNRG